VLLPRMPTCRQLWREAGGDLLLVGHRSVLVERHVHLLRALPAT
jgi:hypothetical protein